MPNQLVKKSTPHRYRSDNRTGFKGVYFDKGKNCYRAAIRFNGVLLHLGYYKSPVFAAAAYNAAALKAHGSNAVLNKLTVINVINLMQPRPYDSTNQPVKTVKCTAISYVSSMEMAQIMPVFVK